jgi:hypothetical protein
MPKREPELPFLPPLTPDELKLLRESPYETGSVIRGMRAESIAGDLVDRDLLERDPTAPRHVRCTEKGLEASTPLSLAGAKRFRDAIYDEIEDDPEAASSKEHALWRRVLLEVESTHTADARLRELARIALSTDEYDFPRYA